MVRFLVIAGVLTALALLSKGSHAYSGVAVRPSFQPTRPSMSPLPGVGRRGRVWRLGLSADGGGEEEEAAALLRKAAELRKEAEELGGVKEAEERRRRGVQEAMEGARKLSEGDAGEAGEELYADMIEERKETLSDGMRERLKNEARSLGADPNSAQTNYILYISVAVGALVILGGKGILF